jgi:CheY-like chemotaxis protein
MNILVAEDNFVNRTLLKKIFEKLGYAADMVQDGKEAIEAIGKKYYDLVILDIEMPEINGIDVTRIIRKQFDKKDRPYVVALTASSLPGEKELFIESGMNDYIAKPFSIESVEMLLQKVNAANL